MIGRDWESIVPAVRERDRNRCQNCLAEGDDVTLNTHHVVPRGQGGSNRMSNLLTLCKQCHAAAHGDTMAPVLRWYSNGEMASDEFSIYREMWQSLDGVRFNYGENGGYWYIPKADAMAILESEVGEFADELIEKQASEG